MDLQVEVNSPSAKDPDLEIDTCAFYKQVNSLQIINVYVVGSLCVVGLVVNMLAFAALGGLKARTRRGTSMLRVLAIFDCLYLLTCLFTKTTYTMYLMIQFIDISYSWLPRMLILGYPIEQMFQMCTLYLLIIVVIERTNALHYHHHNNSQRYSGLLYGVCGTIAILVWCVLFNIPVFFEQQIMHLDYRTECYSPRDIAAGSWLYDNYYYDLIYQTVLSLLFKAFVPLMAICIAFLKLSSASCRPYNVVGGDNNFNKVETSINKMVICVVFFNIIYGMIYLAERIIFCANQAGKHEIFGMDSTNTKFVSHDQYTAVTLTWTVLAVVNASCKFFLYLLISPQFRHSLSRICCCRKEKPNSMRMISLQSQMTDTSNVSL